MSHAAAVGWLYSGLQVMHPGEVASAHAHSASALRFIMEGEGAYTIVDGHKMTLGANDFVLTPNGTWHEHGVSGDGTPCIWQDGLDIPLVNTLEANFYVVHPDLQQSVGYPVDDMTHTWGNPGLRPAGAEWSKGYSPLLKYEWGPTYEALQRYGKATDGSPYDGVLMNYVNPVTGGPVMQTIGASMQMLRPGESTRAHRHTGSFIYQVAKGSGHSIIDGKRFDWKERDIFCVPSWAWHEHVNASASEDACLFTFNDLPVMHALGLYREEAFGDNGGRQPARSLGDNRVRLVTYRSTIEAAARLGAVVDDLVVDVEEAGPHAGISLPVIDARLHRSRAAGAGGPQEDIERRQGYLAGRRRIAAGECQAAGADPASAQEHLWHRPQLCRARRGIRRARSTRQRTCPSSPSSSRSRRPASSGRTTPSITTRRSRSSSTGKSSLPS